LYIPYCGATKKLRETVHVKLEVDNSNMAANCLRLANRAYSIHNYREAYDYTGNQIQTKAKELAECLRAIQENRQELNRSKAIMKE